MRYSMLSLLICLTVVGGCVQQPPIVDTKGVDPIRYETDLRECSEYADQVQAQSQVAGRAAGGAAVGGILGAIFGNSQSVAQGAGAGAVVGGAKGTDRVYRQKEQVVRRCLGHRGYRVLN
ncbi:MAG: glycine zipper family protein [Proteobacteria bacterium]|nr:glycine zipper family protein [Pseudomonadota bacterium]